MTNHEKSFPWHLKKYKTKQQEHGASWEESDEFFTFFMNKIIWENYTMNKVVKSKYLMFAITPAHPHTPSWPHLQCAAIINRESFSIPNVWEAKKKPTSAEKTVMIKIMIKMKGVILK